jgi:hypothetical protein
MNIKKTKNKNKNNLMPSFLMNIDDIFNDMISKKKKISLYDLIELKSFIIEAYEKDTLIDINNLQKSQNILIRNFEDY